MVLCDAHCHLQEPELAAGLGEAMERAADAGVRHMVCCGTSEHDWERSLMIGERYPQVRVSLGLHPWYVERRSENWLRRLERYAERGGIGIGEIGLDHAVRPRQDQQQLEVFVAQVRLARRLGVPVSIHCRKAWGQMLETLRSEGGMGPHGGVLHSYSGAAALVPTFEELGLHISFSGSITRSNNRKGRESVRAVSSERLLIETDSPAILPHGAEHDPNEPSNLRLVLRSAARIRGESEAVVAEYTYENACRLYGIRE